MSSTPERKKILIIATGGTIATRVLSGYFTNIKDLFAEIFQVPQNALPGQFGTAFPLVHTNNPDGSVNTLPTTVFAKSLVDLQLAMTDANGDAIRDNAGNLLLPDIYFYTIFRPTGSGAFNTNVILQVCRAAHEALEGDGLQSLAIIKNGSFVPFDEDELNQVQNKTQNFVSFVGNNLDLTRFNNRDYTYQLALSGQSLNNKLEPFIKFDGVVVTQGSVTSDETAHHLNQLVYTNKPIVVTAANDGRQVPGTESYKNALRSVQLAASEASVGKGVMLCMNNQIEFAREAIKTHLRHDAWRAGDLGSMGTLGEGANVKYYRKTTKNHGKTSIFAQKGMLFDLTRKKHIANDRGISPDGIVDPVTNTGSFIPNTSYDVRAAGLGGEWIVEDKFNTSRKGIDVLPKVQVIQADKDEPAQIIEASIGTSTIMSILGIDSTLPNALILANEKIAALNNLPGASSLDANQRLVGGFKGVPNMEGIYINGFTAYGVTTRGQTPLVNALVSSGYPICIGSRGGPNQRLNLARVLTADNFNYWKALLVFRLGIRLVKNNQSQLTLSFSQYSEIQTYLSTQ
jgi:hypothetical protein